MKKTIVKAACGFFLCSALMATAAFAGPVKCVWENNKNWRHQVINDVPTKLKAVVEDPLAATFEWNFGDGTTSGIMPVVDQYAIEAAHTYTGHSNKTKLTASLTVYDGAGAVIGTDNYRIKVWTAAKAGEKRLKRIAIEEGLWFLNKEFTRKTLLPEEGGAPAGRADYIEDTIMLAQAMVDAGHKANGNPDNPYVDVVQRTVNDLTANLGIMSVTDKDGNNAEARDAGPVGMVDGLGVYVANGREFGFGPALKLLATAGYGANDHPVSYNNAHNFSGGAVADIRQYTYHQIAQQMIDFISWAQLNTCANDYSLRECTEWTTQCNLIDPETGLCVPGYEWEQCTGIYQPAPPKKVCDGSVASSSRGGWPFWDEGWDRGSYGDLSVAKWNIIGVDAAATTLGLTYPGYLKSEINTLILANQGVDGEMVYGLANYMRSIGRAGRGLYLMNWVGIASSDPMVEAQRQFINNKWDHNNYNHRESYRNVDHNCSGDPLDPMSQGDPVEPGDINCYSHFELGAANWNYWMMIDGVRTMVTLSGYDKFNLLTLRDVNMGLGAYGLSINVDNQKDAYLELLLNNQMEDGNWPDNDWADGDSMSSAWAIQTLLEL